MKNMLLLTSIITFLCMAGCATFERSELTRINKLPDVSQYENKPSVFVDFSFLAGLPSENPSEIVKTTQELQPLVQEAFIDSKLFESVTFDSSVKDKQDYTIQIKVFNHGSSMSAGVSGFVTGYTLGLVPGSATDNYTLELKAINKDGGVINEYSNRDSVKTWVGIWFLPVMANTPKKAISSTLDNQIKVALKELIESRSLEYSFIKQLFLNV